MTLTTELNRGYPGLIILVEFSALKLADGSLEPLYFSKPAAYFPDKQFLPCIASIPSIDRDGGDIMDPAYLPTYGNIVLKISGSYKPDAGNAIAWNLLLYKDAYNLSGRSLTIKIAPTGTLYAAYTTIFIGQIGKVSWTDTELTLEILDKMQELETKYPDYALPESPQVDEDSYGATVPALIGAVNNYSPVLIKSGLSGSYTDWYALACHVIDSLRAVYFNQSDLTPPTTPGQYLFTQCDVSPPEADRNNEGVALIYNYGPYTGALLKAKWLIEIDSITALNSQGIYGSRVGLATFRWKLIGDAAWRGEGVLTWLLAYDSTTLAKSPAVGTGILAISGDYTGDCKLAYKVKISRGGDIGDLIPPQFIWSDDNGVTWNPPDNFIWYPNAAAPGVGSVVSYNQGDTVTIIITTGGNVGGAVRFQWSNDGNLTWSPDVQIPDTNPIELFPGYSVQFTAPGIPATDDYDAGDAGVGQSCIDLEPPVAPADPDDPTDPITLNRGLSAIFEGYIGSGVWYNDTQWRPVATAAGVMSIDSIDPAYDENLLDVEITVAGNVGGTVRFKWRYDSTNPLDWSGNTEIPDTSPITLFAGLDIAFTHPGGAPDEYDVGDAWTNIPYYVPAFVADDLWTFTVKEIPIPLEDGVSIQFVAQEGQDFFLGDFWTFILMSTIKVNISDTTDLTVDANGLLSPRTDPPLFVSTLGAIIYAYIRTMREWLDTDFDLPSVDAFDVALPYTVGLVVDSPEAVTATITRLLTGIPAIYSLRTNGKFYIQELTAPVGAPVFDVTDEYIKELPSFEQIPDITKRVYLQYDINYTTNAGSHLTGVSQSRLAWLKREYREVSCKDDAVLDNYPAAIDMGPLETVLSQRADTKLLCSKLLLLNKVPHEYMEIEISLQALQFEIGEEITVVRDKFGQDAGLDYIIVGINIDFDSMRSTVKLWR